jgi:4-hydroxybenzoyl-CoA thioesterase
MLINVKEIKIEWGDCDPAGIVYFPRYFEYFDAATNSLFERAGLPKARMLQTYEIIGIPLVEAHSRFLIPSRFGDSVSIRSSVSEWGRSSFSVHHELLKGSDLAVEGFEKRVWTARSPEDSAKLVSRAIPQSVKDKFQVHPKAV